MNERLGSPPDALQSPELGPEAFARITALAHREAGLHIANDKSAMVRARLARRLRILDLPDFDAYADLVTGDGGRTEISAMISALTTNLSHFFREKHHFEIFRADVLPPLIARARAGGRVRVWSAGCSNGQEPFSIAMTLLDAGMPADADVRILGTDIDPEVIRFARAGVYAEPMLTGLSDQARATYLEQSVGEDGARWQVRAPLRDLVKFRVLNLLEDWPMRGRFDAIFCRNVVIYFDDDARRRLWPRLARALEPGGFLFIGHSERVAGPARRLLSNTNVTTYLRSSSQSDRSAPQIN